LLVGAGECPGVEKLSNDFFRPRGTLLLVQQPWDYYSRSFLLAELDRLSSNRRELAFTTNPNNTLIRARHHTRTPPPAPPAAPTAPARATPRAPPPSSARPAPRWRRCSPPTAASGRGAP